MVHKKKRKRVPPEEWLSILKGRMDKLPDALHGVISKGSLVFDIGANRGIKTYLYRQRGATVVAVEPLLGVTPCPVRHIEHAFGNDPKVTLLPVALSDKIGTALLHVNQTFPGYSSMSRRWVSGLSARQQRGGWKQVPTTTLDALIERFGQPVFTKIDVEGSEHKVLKGLSTPLPLLSLEFHRSLLKSLRICISLLSKLGHYQYNVIIGNETALQYASWIDGDALIRRLRKAPYEGHGGWGDVYARLQPRSWPTSSKLPLDILIPAIDKDLAVLPYAIDGARKNLKHPIGRIIIVAPDSAEIKQVCKDKDCDFVWEDSVLSITRENIDYTVDGLDRSGWLFQQFLKWSGDSLCSQEHYLVLDADLVLLRPHVFEIDGRVVLLQSDIYYKPYWDVYKRLFGIEALTKRSFTTHHMLYNKTRIRELKEQIEAKHGVPWFVAILQNIDKTQGAATSGYELYGQWMLQNHEDEIILEYWDNTARRRSQLGTLGQLARLYSSVAFHSHMKRRES